MFDHWPISDLRLLFVEFRSCNNFCYDEHIHQYLIIYQHSMPFFSSSKWDHSSNSLKMNTFANIWSFTNIRCPFSHHRNEIIPQFLWRWTHSPKFDHWPTSDVLFLYIELRSFINFSYHHKIRECLTIDQNPMSFLYSSRPNQWKISLTMRIFPNVW